jgi:S1-C subfamily serine protease
LRGNVIGVNTAISADGQALGFAIPSNAVKLAIESVKKTGRIIRPWLGVRYFMIDADMAKRENLPVTYGALVSRGSSPRDVAVVSGSPADKAGIIENDIILEIQDQRLSDEQSLATILSRFAPGDEVRVKVLRRSEERFLTLKLDERAADPR